MLIVLGSSRWKKMLTEFVVAATKELENSAESATSAYRKLGDVTKKLAEMEIQQAKKQEEWDRREREIEHKIGLERKRQEFEIEQSKRETKVSVQQDNLAADKERFKSEMDFQRTHLQEEITSLRTLVGQLLKRLPSAEIIATVGGKSNKSGD
jgi:hypothetical protein